MAGPNTAVVPVVPEGASWTPAQVDLIRRTVADKATNDELALFLYQAHRTGLDPLARQIYCVKRGSKATIQTGIDGYRLLAARTGTYAGNDDPQFQGDEDGHPAQATVTVWKIVAGQRCPFTATARWSEYRVEGDGGMMWRRMPYLMLGKCFDEATEVLTDRGFELFRSLTGRVLQVTEQGLKPTDAKPFCQSYDGPMIAFESDDLNFVVTPNHDMLTTDGKIEAGELFEGARSRPKHWIPRCVVSSASDWPIADTAIQLAAAYLADGSDMAGGKFRIEVSRPRKVEALRQLGFYQAERAVASAGVAATTATRTITTRADKTRFIYEFGEIAWLVGPHKLVNTEHLLYLSRRQLRVFVDALVAFDGHTAASTGVRRFYTSRLDLLEAFEVAAVGAGYAVSPRRARQSDISTRDNHYVTISSRSEIPVTRWGREYQGEKGGGEKHTGLEMIANAFGRVWCVTVPSGLIVVRRHGFSMVCGNCAESLALRKAFPAELSGLYTDDEMAQADAPSVSLGARQTEAYNQEEPPPSPKPQPPQPTTAAAAFEASVASPAQVQFIYRLSKDQGLDEAQIDEKCVALYGAPPTEITKKQASDFISNLKVGGV